jgi:activator of HSP90 ATPase
MHEESAASSLQLSRRHWLVQAAVAGCSFALSSSRAYADSGDGVVRTAEAIHQEVSFNTKAKRLYEALTDASLFQKVELLSAAMKSADVNSHPAMISREPGGSFSLFGNYIVGRQLELVPDRRIVQAWRVESWAPGIYSVVRFEFAEHDSTTNLVFNHAGFPSGLAEHLAEGWYANYWEPLRKFLG